MRVSHRAIPSQALWGGRVCQHRAERVGTHRAGKPLRFAPLAPRTLASRLTPPRVMGKRRTELSKRKTETLVHSGCSHKNTIGWGLKQQILFSQFWMAGRPKSKPAADSRSGEAFLAQEGCLLTLSSPGARGEGLCGATFPRASIAF